MQTGMTTKAITHYEAALDVEPQDWKTRRALSVQLACRGLKDKAQEHMNIALRYERQEKAANRKK